MMLLMLTVMYQLENKMRVCNSLKLSCALHDTLHYCPDVLIRPLVRSAVDYHSVLDHRYVVFLIGLALSQCYG
jgi:hypothetical protein